ncbi:hypothetical protein [Sporosarcina sp. ZBG7A]|uniref:hypothetical protein n=1 Tax=Sporosarcina sp. ZBG7A TaxID=1582223 RepID=UPI00057AFF85|nr:hypothetical protein [Sporosarcina sp. ZBG7A]
MVNPDSLDFIDIDVGGQAAKIDVIGSVITIIGESISTYAAVLAIEEEKKNSPNNEDLVNELKEMKEQILYLTNEIQSLKKNQSRDSPWRL